MTATTRTRQKAAENPPLGLVNLDAPSQEALAMYLIGLRFAREGALRLSRGLRDHDGYDPEIASADIGELRKFARHAPFLLEWMAVVKSCLWSGATDNAEDLYRMLRTYLRNAVRPVDPPVTVREGGEA